MVSSTSNTSTTVAPVALAHWIPTGLSSNITVVDAALPVCLIQAINVVVSGFDGKSVAVFIFVKNWAMFIMSKLRLINSLVAFVAKHILIPLSNWYLIASYSSCLNIIYSGICACVWICLNSLKHAIQTWLIL